MTGAAVQEKTRGSGANVAARQGYVTMAYGARKFFEMAANLALSVKLNDPLRPITLLHKKSTPPPTEIAMLFDRAIPFENEEKYPGVTIKLAIFEPTPYAEAFYIDADCLLMKPDMDRHWAKYGASDFNISGDVKTTGSAYGCDVEKMMAAAGVSYFIDMNCGIIFFRKNDGGRRVFEAARALQAERHPDLIETRPRRGDGLSDQPYFAGAMARNGVRPVSYTPEEGTLMATTWRASGIDFDLENRRSQLKKPTGFFLLDRLWAKGWVAHDTTVAHFIELKPLAEYQRLSDWLRDRFGVPRFDFS
jgi:hypothetical protein